MSKYAYIFVERNMGNDYAHAYPLMGFIRSWMWQHKIYDAAQCALNAKVDNLRSVLPGDDFNKELASGILTHTYICKHTVVSVKIAPDTLCPDPRAEGRCPYFVMHLLLPGMPEVISRRFGKFRDQCLGIAWQTMRSGEQNELKVKIPKDLYYK